MKIAIYTSFAINYLAKARVLVQTVKQHNPDIDVIGLVCDRFPPWIDLAREPFDQVWMVEEYPAIPIRGWIFRHNIMELSTAVKGWALKRLLDAGYDYVLYLDPDCWVLEDPAKMVALLRPEFSVGVVPHTTRSAESDEEIRIVETSSLRHGIYNLGFLLVRNDDNGRRLAHWWAARLDKYCIDDFANGLFTDQRWFDLALGYFDFITVIRHWGIDVASWNVGQRVLSRNGTGYRVDGHELIFYHFSGVGPTGVHRWVRDKFAPADPLAAELEFRYEALIKAAGQAELETIVPFFDRYADGRRVEPHHRAVYRKSAELQKRYPDPYVVWQPGNFRDEAALDDASPQLASVPLNLGDRDAAARRLFDPVFYRMSMSSEESDADRLWDHYKACGWEAMVLPNRFFDTAYYMLSVPEGKRSAFPTPLHHYVAVGIKAGLSPSWIYSDAYYLRKYADIREAVRGGYFFCGFEHFSHDGAKEGRDGCPYFNERAYVIQHADVADAIAQGEIRSGEAHYVAIGCEQQRALR
jgi:hypothetical protein